MERAARALALGAGTRASGVRGSPRAGCWRLPEAGAPRPPLRNGVLGGLEGTGGLGSICSLGGWEELGAGGNAGRVVRLFRGVWTKYPKYSLSPKYTSLRPQDTARCPVRGAPASGRPSAGVSSYSQGFGRGSLTELLEQEVLRALRYGGPGGLGMGGNTGGACRAMLRAQRATAGSGCSLGRESAPGRGGRAREGEKARNVKR